jgi:thiopeptide-type bacteriocin biosynthesis protein
MELVAGLAESLLRDQEVVRTQRFFVNSTIYEVGDRVRYTERQGEGDDAKFGLVAVEKTPYLMATLRRAVAGATGGELAAGLSTDDPEISDSEALGFVEQLAGAGLLVSGLVPPLTGCDAGSHLAVQLARSLVTRPIAERLERVISQLAETDAKDPERALADYLALADTLQALPGHTHPAHLVQVDLYKPAIHASVDGRVVSEALRGVNALWMLDCWPEETPTDRFITAFRERYGDQEVPLLEALDEDVGIGFEPSGASDPEPLLTGIAMVPRDDHPPQTTWGDREVLLLAKLQAAWSSDENEIHLTEKDLLPLADKPRADLPGAFHVWFSIAANSPTALREGNFRLFLRGASGPSGINPIARFCHLDPGLDEAVREFVRQEEAREPDRIFAEIVHLPKGRMGNILQRPILRGYEIPFLGVSGVAPSCQIPASDLMVSATGGRLMLRSRRLQREVVPRLSSAHNYSSAKNVSVYRFLGLLKDQSLSTRLVWRWGPFENSPSLPRVSIGRVVLSRACWRLSEDERSHWKRLSGTKRFRKVRDWCDRWGLPRLICLKESDQEFLVDLSNALAVDSLVAHMEPNGDTTFVEMFPGEADLCCHGPEGRFVHEILMPFVREGKATQAVTTSTRVANSCVRTFPPGSEWVYAKLYTGTAAADLVLCDSLAPLVDTLVQSGVIDRWFFLRYRDPGWHIRIRFHLVDRHQHTRVVGALQELFASEARACRASRLQLDTYDREVERYGGASAIEACERLFHADSIACLEVLQILRREGLLGADERWRLLLIGMARFLDDFGLDLEAQVSLVKKARDRFQGKHWMGALVRSAIGKRFRSERSQLEAMMCGDTQGREVARGAFGCLENRSRFAGPAIQRLLELEASGELTVPRPRLVGTLIHMHANRMLRSRARANETVLYHFLLQLLASAKARRPRK